MSFGRLRAGIVTAAGIALGAGSITMALPAAAADTGAVYVVHGIPDTPVDVYVDGALALDDLQPVTVAGPVDLPAGQHDVAITAPDAADASAPLIEATAEVPAGGNVSLVAHLDAAGNPTITPFVNDTATIPAGQARLVVRHTAAAPAVDVRANGQPVITNLTNPNEEALVVPAGTISADVVPTGTTTPVIGPVDLTLAEGSATFVHAIGSLDADTLTIVSFTISGLHSSPGGVPAGNGALPADSSGTWTLVGAGAFALLGAGLLTLGARRREERSLV